MGLEADILVLNHKKSTTQRKLDELDREIESSNIFLKALRQVSRSTCICKKEQDNIRVVSQRIIETNRHGIFTRDMEAIHIFHIPRLFRPVEV